MSRDNQALPGGVYSRWRLRLRDRPALDGEGLPGSACVRRGPVPEGVLDGVGGSPAGRRAPTLPCSFCRAPRGRAPAPGGLAGCERAGPEWQAAGGGGGQERSRADAVAPGQTRARARVPRPGVGLGQRCSGQQVRAGVRGHGWPWLWIQVLLPSPACLGPAWRWRERPLLGLLRGSARIPPAPPGRLRPGGSLSPRGPREHDRRQRVYSRPKPAVPGHCRRPGPGLPASSSGLPGGSGRQELVIRSLYGCGSRAGTRHRGGARLHHPAATPSKCHQGTSRRGPSCRALRLLTLFFFS